MKPTGTVFFLAGALLAVSPATSAPAEPRESASTHLGIVFAPVKTAEAAAVEQPPSSVDVQPPIVLPKFDVRESRFELEYHRLLTAKGQLAEAKRQELSPAYQKTFGPLAAVAAIYFNPLSLLMGVRANDAEAMVLYEQDEHIRRRHEADSLVDLLKDADPAAYRELRAATRNTFQLRSPNTGEH